MSLSEAEYLARLQEFQADLDRPSSAVVQKHILTGSPAALSASDYFDLRHEVAMHFGIQPIEVVLVGSCRTGFTLMDKPKQSRPRYTRVESGSDLDIVVVSTRLFDTIWDTVFDYAQESAAFRKSDEAVEFRGMLFRGWIDPRGMPPGQRFELAERWIRFFDRFGRDRRFGNRRATARVYRDWVRLATYQQIAVEGCKRARREGR